ncbi:hypothetical protein G3578_14170 [Brevibacillus sp. SYP-B805]|uniref:hypothetical protein n=1 Tax=Brevibacillus sp. SYP-B805 TaxID=1578199 RepID=UPI0013EDB3C9|nr:hypothetical protein [Brevibacillus sp. SYP-B805]NGQ96307.1 hypothetical protein [Brevibacillus sp. SYP-B805]
MTQPFAPFASSLSRQQVSLLLDTVLYFEDAPKLLSIPDGNETPVAVPLLPETLRSMLDSLPEDEPFAKGRFQFDWLSHGENLGELLVTLPTGETIRQRTALDQFSPL